MIAIGYYVSMLAIDVTVTGQHSRYQLSHHTRGKRILRRLSGKHEGRWKAVTTVAASERDNIKPWSLAGSVGACDVSMFMSSRQYLTTIRCDSLQVVCCMLILKSENIVKCREAQGRVPVQYQEYLAAGRASTLGVSASPLRSRSRKIDLPRSRSWRFNQRVVMSRLVHRNMMTLIRCA